MAVITNKELLALCKSDPTYQSWTSKLSDKIFTDAGFEEVSLTGGPILADFFNLSVRVILQKIKTPSPKIPNLYKSIVEEYGNSQGGIFQRINTKLIKPTDPKYRNLVNGGSVDPFIVRKPETEERFYKQNYDYQNLLTIQDIELKKMFLSESGISDYVAGIMKSLDDAYAIQKYEIFREMLHKALTSTNFPLKVSQQVQVKAIDNSASNQDMAEWLQVFHNFHDLMESTVVSGEFNAKGYEHGLYTDEYTLMVRADVWNCIKTTLLATTYHTDNLTIPFKVEIVKDFGGITYTDMAGNTMIPVYDEFGAVKGYNASGSDTDPLVDKDSLVKIDPHANIDALLVQRGAIFTTSQQPYETRAIYNPAGRYTNFWASQPNQSFNYDACYDIVEFYHV